MSTRIGVQLLPPPEPEDRSRGPVAGHPREEEAKADVQRGQLPGGGSRGGDPSRVMNYKWEQR